MYVPCKVANYCAGLEDMALCAHIQACFSSSLEVEKKKVRPITLSDFSIWAPRTIRAFFSFFSRVLLVMLCRGQFGFCLLPSTDYSCLE